FLFKLELIQFRRYLNLKEKKIYSHNTAEETSEGYIDEPREEAPLGSSESKSKVENAELEGPQKLASPIVTAPKQNESDESSSTKRKLIAAKTRKAKRKRTKPKPRPPTDSISAVLKASPGKAKDKSPRPSAPTPPFPLTSVFSPDEEPSFAQLSKFSLLLENRTFVDYLNVFLSLPIFGQHVYYNFLEKTFEFEPPIRQENGIFTNQHKVLCWLYNRRFAFFKKTSLYFEFLMTSELKTAKICIQGIPDKDITEDTEDTSNLCKNLFGSVVGMMLFRESLRNTCGERVLSCWKDIARWRCLEDHDPEKHFLKNEIKVKYISNGSNDVLPERSLKLVLEGRINAEILPDEELLLDVLEGTGFEDRVFELDSESSFTKLQKIMMCALTMYWVKRYVVHLQTTVPLEKLRVLFRPPPGEEVSVARERKLRCLQMFPSVFLKADIDASLTCIQVLNSTHTTEEVAEQLQNSCKPVEDVHVHTTSDIKKELSKQKDLVFSAESISSDCPRKELIDEEESAMWKTLTSRQSHKTIVPIIVSSFMTGTRNMFSAGYPYFCNRIMWSLAADILSGSPFKTYLKEYGQALDLHYLEFWTDVRNYLSADNSSCNTIGNSTKSLLFYKIAKTYLMSGGEASDIFSESLKMSLLWDLSNHNDISLMHVANDIVIQALCEPLQSYINADRKTCLNRLQDHRSLLTYQQMQKQQAGLSVDQSADNMSNPMYSFSVENRVRGRADILSSHPSHGFYQSDNSRIPNRAKSSKQDHTDPLKEQMWRAMEFAILCTEYGNKGMVPQVVPGIDVLLDSFYDDSAGSLHIRKQPSVKNDWLSWLLKKPKIDIEKIRVSRKAISENLLVQPKKVIRNLQSPALFMKRRNAMLLQRPPRPRSLEDVLRSKDQYEFFKRFMALKNALTPLLFWREVEDLNNMPYIKNRRMRVVSIFRKFFGQNTQYGALLDCDEEIIKQLPFMDKVTPALLFCAQNAVYGVLERKWFSAYLDTFPPDVSEKIIHYPEDEQSLDASKKDVLLGRPRKGIKKRSSRNPIKLWRSFFRILLKFRRGLNHYESLIKFQTYLEVDAEQEQNKKVADTQKTGDGKKSSSVLQITTSVKKKTVPFLKNRMSQDLCFWMEILRYMDLVDSLKASGETSTEHAQILIDKATAIVTVYLVSEVPPAVQVNISDDMASVIISSLQTAGPTRGLFHEAIMHLFPLLFVSWKKFCQEELAGSLPEAYFLRLYKKITKALPTISPHKNESFPDYIHIKDDCVTIIHGAATSFEENMRITFSIMEGIRYFICTKDTYDVLREREELQTAKRQKESPNQLRSPTRSRKQSGDGRLQLFTHADSLVVGEQDLSKRRHSSLPSSQTALDTISHNEGHAEGDKPRIRRLSKLLDDTPSEITTVVKETKMRRGNRRVSKPQI
ncbi:hypothetical protein CHS0354_009368, partial [Potamilus streckersoni]